MRQVYTLEDVHRLLTRKIEEAGGAGKLAFREGISPLLLDSKLWTFGAPPDEVLKILKLKSLPAYELDNEAFK
jgi:hypothetical protein